MQIVLHMKTFYSQSKKNVNVKLYFDYIRLFFPPISTKLQCVCNVQQLLMVTDMDPVQWKVVAV